MDRLRKLAGILTESTNDDTTIPSMEVSEFGQYIGQPFETDYMENPADMGEEFSDTSGDDGKSTSTFPQGGERSETDVSTDADAHGLPSTNPLATDMGELFPGDYQDEVGRDADWDKSFRDLPRGRWNQIVSDEFSEEDIDDVLNTKIATDMITAYVDDNADSDTFAGKYMAALRGFDDLGETLVIDHGLNLTSIQEETIARAIANGGNTLTLAESCSDFGVTPIYDGDIAILTFPSNMVASQFDSRRKTIKEAHVSYMNHNVNNGVVTMKIKLL